MNANDSTRKGRVLNVTAAIVGNTLEWFDILVYATFVSYISANFFPGDPSVATLAALGAFGTSFIIRPIGAVVTGWIADRSGRRSALTITSILMFVGTGIIAFLPNHAQIGITAPILLVTARLIQGFAAGGEFGSATAYLAEQSHRHRGYFASWQFASQGLGVVIAALFGGVLTAAYSEKELTDWAWRIPFYFGMLVGPVGYVIRYHADESPEFVATKALTAGGSVRPKLSKDFWQRVFTATALVIVASASLHMLISFPTLATSQFGIPREFGMWTQAYAGAILLVVTPLSGALGDRIGRQWLALTSCTALVFAPPALFELLDTAPTTGNAMLVQLVLSLFAAVFLGALAAMMSDLFVPANRSMGLAVSYNVAVLLGGAFAPLIYAALSVYIGRVAPSYYVSGAALISLIAVIFVMNARWLPQTNLVQGEAL